MGLYYKSTFFQVGETLYSLMGKIVYAVEKPCNIYRLRGNPMIPRKAFKRLLNICSVAEKLSKLSYLHSQQKFFGVSKSPILDLFLP